MFREDEELAEHRHLAMFNLRLSGRIFGPECSDSEKERAQAKRSDKSRRKSGQKNSRVTSSVNVFVYPNPSAAVHTPYSIDSVKTY
jgi:hypothetical protein